MGKKKNNNKKNQQKKGKAPVKAENETPSSPPPEVQESEEKVEEEQSEALRTATGEHTQKEGESPVEAPPEVMDSSEPKEGSLEEKTAKAEIPEELTLKHPLKHPWSLWYKAPNPKVRGDWLSALNKVATVSTVEDFWALFFHIKSCSVLEHLADLSLFKDGIKPTWEDQANSQGGRWTLQVRGDWLSALNKVATVSTVEDFWALFFHIKSCSVLEHLADLSLFKDGIKPTWEDQANSQGGRWTLQVRYRMSQELWRELQMMLIGEQFEDLNDEICGGVVNIRTKGDKVCLWTRDANLDTDKALKIGMLMKKYLRTGEELHYESHAESKVKNSSTTKALLKV